MKKIIIILSFSLFFLLTSCEVNDIPFYPKSKVEYKLTGSTNCAIQYIDEYGGTVSTGATGNWSYTYKVTKGTYYMLYAKNLDLVNSLTGEVLVNGNSIGKQTTSASNPYVDFSGKVE